MYLQKQAAVSKQNKIWEKRCVADVKETVCWTIATGSPVIDRQSCAQFCWCRHYAFEFLPSVRSFFSALYSCFCFFLPVFAGTARFRSNNNNNYCGKRWSISFHPCCNRQTEMDNSKNNNTNRNTNRERERESVTETE